MWGDRRWPICHSWIAARESSSQLVVLVLWPRRGVLAGRVREGAAAAVKTNPGRELRHCMRRQFLRLLLGRASDRPWAHRPGGSSTARGGSSTARAVQARGGSSAGRCRRGMVQALCGAVQALRGALRGAALRGVALRGKHCSGAVLRGKHCAGRFSARGPCDRRFSGGVVQSKLRDAALHGVAVLEEVSRVNARKRPSRQRRLVESQGG